MKITKGFLAILMVMLLCIGIFAGCSTATTTNNDDDDDSDTTLGDLSNNSDDDTLTDDAEDIIGEVTYVGTSYLSLSSYESESEISDYTTVDTSTLTEVGSTEYVYPDDSAEYYTVSDGVLVSATSDDVVASCLIAVTTDTDGTQQIIILKAANAEDDVTDATDDSDTADETSDVIAEVTTVNEDGTLELSLYEVLDDTLEITDYAAVDLDNYYDSYITETYTIADDAVITVVTDGVLTETTVEEIVVGDILVIYSDEYATTNIAVYHAEEDETA